MNPYDFPHPNKTIHISPIASAILVIGLTVVTADMFYILSCILRFISSPSIETHRLLSAVPEMLEYMLMTILLLVGGALLADKTSMELKNK